MAGSWIKFTLYSKITTKCLCVEVQYFSSASQLTFPEKIKAIYASRTVDDLLLKIETYTPDKVCF